MLGAAGATASTVPFQGTEPGSTPRAALQSLWVSPVPVKIAKELIVRNHYLHSLPGGTQITFGVFLSGRLLGIVVLGVGSFNAKSLVEDAVAEDCLTLTRLWLSDDLPKNSESRVIGAVLRFLKKDTELKFILSYADPAQGHVGTIYQATGWIYTGLSVAMPLYDTGDGKLHHSRSLAHAYGTHSMHYFARHGVTVQRIPQSAKHRYIYLLDRSWENRLRVPALPYPKLKRTYADS